MVDSSFLSTQNKNRNCSSCSAQGVITRFLEFREAEAAFYLKNAQTSQSQCLNQAALFSKMSAQEVQDYKQLLCSSCSNQERTADSFSHVPPLLEPVHSQASFQTTQTSKATASEHSEQTHRQRLLTWIQPGLAGLMDGSVSTLAPIFAAAFATVDTHQTFLIGLSASIGAGLSMGFTEAAHDDGKLSGRGSPLKRGIANGTMTMLGGLGHTLPYLIHSFYLATIVAFIVVFFELWAIVWIQNKFMSTPFWRASLQVAAGGALVFATGILIGSA